MSTVLLDAALDLAARGFKVFQVQTAVPLGDGRFVCGCGRLGCTRPAKHPLPRFAPHGLHSASRSENVVRHWWTAIPHANIGLVTGEVVVLDIDTHKGGADSLAALEHRHGPLPSTWRALTGGGGEHIYFAAPADQEVRNSVEKFMPGLDIRGVGGYVLAPPSLHVSGRTYAWSVDHHPDEVALAAMPDWLVEASRKAPAAGQGTSADWRRMVGDGVSEGARNQSITRLTGHLLRRYVDPIVTHELMQSLNAARFHPPLSAMEVTGIVASVARKELRRREARDARR